MAPFADPEDLRIHLGLTEVDVERAAALLEQASDMIRQFTGRVLSAVTAETVLLDGNDRATILLPEWPVSQVRTVEIAGEPETGFSWSENGVLELDSGVWPRGRRNVEVKYDHGFNPIPEDLRHACLAMAGGALAFREQALPETFGVGIPEARGFPPHMTLDVAIRRQLEGYRRFAA